MFYDKSITIIAGTTEAAPKRVTLSLPKGLIHRMEVEFPLGCRGYVYCKMRHFGGLNWPTNSEGYFRTDGYTIAWDEHYELNAAPFELEIYGWSPDADYPHTLNIRVGMFESKLELLFVSTLKALGKFLKMVGVKV